MLRSFLYSKFCFENISEPFRNARKGFSFWRVVTVQYLTAEALVMDMKTEANNYEFEENDPEHQWGRPHVHL